MKKINYKDIYTIFALSCLAGCSVGICINSMGLFYTPISEDIGCLRGSIAICSTIITFSSAVFNLITAKYLNNENYKKYLFVGMLVTSFGMLVMSMSINLILFYICSLIIGIGSSLYSMVIISTILNSNFKENRGLYTGIVFSVSGLSSAVLSIIVSKIIEKYDYHNALLGVAIINLVLCLPSLFMEADYQPKHLEGHNSSVGIFRYDIIILTLLNFIYGGLTAFTQNYTGFALEKVNSSQVGAYMLSASMIGNAVFKLLFGYLADHFNIRKLTIVVMIINLCSIIIFRYSDSGTLMIICAFIYGIIYAAKVVLISLLSKQFFEDDYQNLYPIVSFGGHAGSGLYSPLLAYSYDYSGNYNEALSILFDTNIGSISLLFLLIALSRRKKK